MKELISLKAFLNKWLKPNDEKVNEFENDLNRLEVKNEM